jgi:hypothetical protein
MDKNTDNGLIELAKDPILKYQREVKEAVKKFKIILDKSKQYKYIQINPQAPNLSALIKPHKVTVQVPTFTSCSGNRWVETLIYIPGRIQGDLDSRRYVVGGFGNLFRMINTVACLLYGYYLVITRSYTILDNTHISKLQYLVQR